MYFAASRHRVLAAANFPFFPNIGGQVSVIILSQDLGSRPRRHYILCIKSDIC